MDSNLRKELLQMIDEDERVRERLAADGSLFDGYHSAMEAVHKKNSSRLREIIDLHGWPGMELVGKDGEEAAWRIVQHSIGEPAFQKSMLQLFKVTPSIPGWQIAMLEDRIRLFEGKKQIYGTHFDWDAEGQMSPAPDIEDPENVNERRREVGLCSIEEEIKKRRSLRNSEKPPADRKALELKMEQWAKSVGWRKSDAGEAG